MPLSAFCLLLSLPFPASFSLPLIVSCAMEIIFLICFEVPRPSTSNGNGENGEIFSEVDFKVLVHIKHRIERALSA